METFRQMKIIKVIFMLPFFLSGVFNVTHINAMEKPLVFSTWEGFEIDKCASIWLIKNFIDKNAVIKILPKEEEIREGVAFDTPDAKFRRYHNMSTYESLLKHYNLNDPNLVYIGKIIHDIEVNIWERKVLKETLIVQDAINDIILKSQNNDEIIEKSSKYFDSLYLSLVTRKDEKKRGNIP